MSLKRKYSQHTYRGKNLLQIAMPLGGIGAGCICLNGCGGLQDFSIRHQPVTSAEPDRHMPQDAGFALLHLPDQGQTRLVEGPLPPEKIYNLGLKSQGYNGGGFEGLPRFRSASFRGAYPFGEVRLKDPGLPVNVTITGFSPLIPLDDLNSSIPCALLEYTLHNQSSNPVRWEFSYHLSHLAQKGAETSARSAAIPGLGVHFWNEAPAAAPAFGSAGLAILGSKPQIKARWFSGGWFDAVSVLWREVSTGSFQESAGLESGSQLARCGGSVMVSGELAPGGRCTIPVAITWHFPNLPAAACSDSPQLLNLEPALHPFYAAHWQDARAVLLYLQSQYSQLRSRTKAFQQALFSSTLPAAVIEAVSANLAILKTPTLLRFENGDIWGWEGCFSNQGCCAGSCTHVWNYAQSIPHLFPQLERTLRKQELQTSMDNRGHVNFRSPPAGQSAAHNFHAASDGQLGGILKVYREWQISGDKAWLAEIYPLVRRSLDFCIAQWDPQRQGLLSEPHHNTYDIEFWGPDGMCSSYYAAALNAMAALAQAVGLPADSANYAQLAQNAAQQLDAVLFNGDYYQQQVTWTGLKDTRFANLLSQIADRSQPTPEEKLLLAEGPKYQYGSGCLSDGVVGAWLAKFCGIPSPQNPAHLRRHLRSVFNSNFKPNLWEHANTQRPGYALGDEAGLLLCTWPRGGKPTLPFVYSDEVWTGIEYQVASHLISEGMLAEGLTLVEAVRSRYDGHRRNPWNEYECGSYYARAMSSYALLAACSGFWYSAVTHSLSIAPVFQPPFSSFFCTASGWGTFCLEQDRLAIHLQEGTLQVDELNLQYSGRVSNTFPGICLSAGERSVILLNPHNSPPSSQVAG